MEFLYRSDCFALFSWNDQNLSCANQFLLKSYSSGTFCIRMTGPLLGCVRRAWCNTFERKKAFSGAPNTNSVYFCTVETQSDITYLPTYVNGASTCSTIILRLSTGQHSVVPNFSHVHIKCGNEKHKFQFAMTIFDSTVTEPNSSSETHYEIKLLVNASCNLSHSNDEIKKSQSLCYALSCMTSISYFHCLFFKSTSLNSQSWRETINGVSDD